MHDIYEEIGLFFLSDSTGDDIKRYISKLQVPQRILCYKVIVLGESFPAAAKQCGVSSAAARRIVRGALAPLAAELGISVTFSKMTDAGRRTGDGGVGGRSKRYSGRVETRKTPGEVVAK